MTIGWSVRPSCLRARMAGTVMRLPGTGEGVARLVAVSKVKVDMGPPSNRSFECQPPRRCRGPTLGFRNDWNLARSRRDSPPFGALRCASRNGEEVMFKTMIAGALLTYGVGVAIAQTEAPAADANAGATVTTDAQATAKEDPAPAAN